jgi:phenylpropionate dioxygenase-like ring-hydroxylating dioxygenase large terminal subunit
MFLNNAWYVAAWDDEVGRQPLARTLLNEPVVLYRDGDGGPVALEDRCCHRHLPLHMGKVDGDNIQCGYHGLTFDRHGQCVSVPGQTAVPPGASVRSYPVVERHRWVWIWMGDPTRADAALIPDFHWLVDPAWGSKGTVFHVDCHYQLVMDNLLDPSHIAFVHADTIGNAPVVDQVKVKTERDGDIIRVTRWTLDAPAAPTYAEAGKFTGNIDRWQITEAIPPCFIRHDSGGAPAGTGVTEGDRSQAIGFYNFDAITPETETSCHFFWACAHDFKVDDPAVTEWYFQQIHQANSEDVGILEAQQKSMSRDSEAPMVDINFDNGPTQARRIVDDLLDAERSGAAAPADQLVFTA